jgi:hypothetical protein
MFEREDAPQARFDYVALVVNRDYNAEAIRCCDRLFVQRYLVKKRVRGVHQ